MTIEQILAKAHRLANKTMRSAAAPMHAYSQSSDNINIQQALDSAEDAVLALRTAKNEQVDNLNRGRALLQASEMLEAANKSLNKVDF